MSKYKTPIERFLANFKVLDNGCWEWTGVIGSGNYGRFWNGKSLGLAHRFSYEWFVAQIPEGLTLDHLCRNRRCVNPDHLEAVTLRENTLRGIGIAAKAARATHCPHGHPYDLFNTYINVNNGFRACRACKHNYKITHTKQYLHTDGVGE